MQCLVESMFLLGSVWIEFEDFVIFLGGLGKLILAESSSKSWLAYLNFKKAVDYQKLFHTTVLMEICTAGHIY